MISDDLLGGRYSYRSSKSVLNTLIKTAAIEYARVNKYAVIAGLNSDNVQRPQSAKNETSNT